MVGFLKEARVLRLLYVGRDLLIVSAIRGVFCNPAPAELQRDIKPSIAGNRILRAQKQGEGTTNSDIMFSAKLRVPGWAMNQSQQERAVSAMTIGAEDDGVLRQAFQANHTGQGMKGRCWLKGVFNRTVKQIYARLPRRLMHETASLCAQYKIRERPMGKAYSAMGLGAENQAFYPIGHSEQDTREGRVDVGGLWFDEYGKDDDSQVPDNSSLPDYGSNADNDADCFEDVWDEEEWYTKYDEECNETAASRAADAWLQAQLTGYTPFSHLSVVFRCDYGLGRLFTAVSTRK